MFIKRIQTGLARGRDLQIIGRKWGDGRYYLSSKQPGGCLQEYSCNFIFGQMEESEKIEVERIREALREEERKIEEAKLRKQE